MNTSTILRLLFLVLFLWIAVYRMRRDLEFGRIVKNEKPIEYSNYSKRISPGRNKSYYITIYYAHQEFESHISKEEYEALDRNIKPKLLYCEKYNEVFTSSERDLKIMYSILICGGLLLFYWGVDSKWMSAKLKSIMYRKYKTSNGDMGRPKEDKRLRPHRVKKKK